MVPACPRRHTAIPPLAPRLKTREAEERRAGTLPKNLSATPCHAMAPTHAHPRRNFGSRASRSESPKRLKPNTARLMARPGNTAIHGAFSEYDGAEPESISPQDGVGSAVPRPRKLRDASVRMAPPSWAVRMVR